MQPKARFGIFDWAAQWRGSRGGQKREREVLGRGNGTGDSDWRLRLGAGTVDGGNYDSGATFTTVSRSPLPPCPSLKLVAHTVERHVNINVCRHNKTDWKRIAKLPPTPDSVPLPLTPTTTNIL